MARNLQEHILQIASELFYRQGIQATGVDAIVKVAGTTKMSLYKYFPSKDALVLAHLDKSRHMFRARLGDGLAACADQPRQKLLAVFDVFAQLQASPEFRGCPFINAAAEFNAENNPVQQATAGFYQDFRQLLTELAQQAGVADAEELSAQLAMLVVGATVSEQIQRQSGAMVKARAAAEVLIENSLAEARHA